MLKRIHQHIFLIATVLFAVLGFIFLHRLTGDAPKVADIAGLFVCTSLFGFAAISGYMEELERKLNKWLEPKMSGSSVGSLSGVCSNCNDIRLEAAKSALTGTAQRVAEKWAAAIEIAKKVSNPPESKAVEEQHSNPPVDPYPHPPHRYDIEHALVHAMAPGLQCRMSGSEVGQFIRDATDAILSGGLPASKRECICSPNQGCTNCPSAGAKADQRAEAEIIGQNLTAPRVTAELIQVLIDGLTWRYEHHESPQIIFAHAFIGDFYLATGFSKPVSAENFSPALGMKYAREQAEGKARDKLWELEGYALAQSLRVLPS